MTEQVLHGASGKVRYLAIAGAAILALVVPIFAKRLTVGPFPLDAVTMLVPLAVIAAYPLMRRIGVANQPWYSVELPGAAFIMLAILSALVAAPTVASVLTIVRYSGYLLLVVAVGSICRDAGSRRFLLWVLTLSGSATVLLAGVQWVAPEAGKGMLGLSADVSTRVYSTFGNPNFYGEFLVLLFAVTLALVLTERNFLRFVAIVALVGCSVALLLTYTRGSWLALAVGLLVAVGTVNSRLVWPIIGLGAAGVAVLPGVAARVLSIFSLSGTASFRLQLWRIAGESIARHPLFGFGPGDFYGAFRDVSLSRPELSIGYLQFGAHNAYLTITAEIGLLGGLIFVILVANIVRMGLYLSTQTQMSHPDRLQNAALTAGLIAFALNGLTSNSFQHPQAAVFFFFLAGMQAGLGMRYLSEKIVPAPAPIDPRHRPWLDGSLVVRVVRSVGRTLRLAWGESALRRVILAPPLFGGMLVAKSRVGSIVFGPGIPTEA